MPLKSKVQEVKLHILENEGKLPKGTAHKWKEHTPDYKNLPKYAPKKKKSKAQYFSLLIKIASVEGDLAKDIKQKHPDWTFDEIITEVTRILKKKEPISKRAMFSNPISQEDKVLVNQIPNYNSPEVSEIIKKVIEQFTGAGGGSAVETISHVLVHQNKDQHKVLQKMTDRVKNAFGESYNKAKQIVDKLLLLILQSAISKTKQASYKTEMIRRAMRDGGWRVLPISVIVEEEPGAPSPMPWKRGHNNEHVYVGYIRDEKVVSIGHPSSRNYIKVSDILAGGRPKQFSFSNGMGGRMTTAPHSMERVYSFVRNMGPDSE